MTEIENKKFFVNLFAEYILDKIGISTNTKIEIVHLDNFIVIKGLTSSNEILNLIEIKQDFIDLYKDYNFENHLSHTIDLIEYGVEMKRNDILTFRYHNSENCSYEQKVLDSCQNMIDLSQIYNSVLDKLGNSMIVTSGFPFGYSLSQKRLLYYYAKHIIYSIPPTYYFRNLEMTISDKKCIEQELNVVNSETNDRDSVLISAILDSFDFEMGWIENEIKKMDWFYEVTNPLNDFDFLKRGNSDFIIL